MRLPEHDFVVSYPMSRTVYLANAVLSLNNTSFPVHPYVGFVFGSTVYPTHAPTSEWQVQLDPQRYNLGDVGIRVSV